MQFILNRLREPSTWAAISAMGVAFGLPAGTVDAAAQVVIGLTGLAGIFLKDRADASK